MEHQMIKTIHDAPSKLSVLQSIRMSRIRLGCALEQLENFEPGPGAIEQLHDHAENVAAEIDALIRTTQQFVGR
jgi:hypothetical protein